MQAGRQYLKCAVEMRGATPSAYDRSERERERGREGEGEGECQGVFVVGLRALCVVAQG